MADKISREKRSINMSKIKGKDSKLEMKLRKTLFAQGIRYRLNYPLYGKPDIVIPLIKVAIFVNGCFWHQHNNCSLSYMPKSNVNFWKTKLLRNIERDREVKLKLENDGWTILLAWECDIENSLETVTKSLINKLTNIQNTKLDPLM